MWPCRRVVCDLVQETTHCDNDNHSIISGAATAY